jgi:hypothetical protein
MNKCGKVTGQIWGQGVEAGLAPAGILPALVTTPWGGSGLGHARFEPENQMTIK